jgi:hypothetical protein
VEVPFTYNIDFHTLIGVESAVAARHIIWTLTCSPESQPRGTRVFGRLKLFLYSDATRQGATSSDRESVRPRHTVANWSAHRWRGADIFKNLGSSDGRAYYYAR